MNKLKQKIKNNNKIYVFLKRIQNAIRNSLISIIQIFLFIFPINKNKVVVSNYYGQGYGDNGKSIIDELHKLNKNCTIVWLVKQNDPAMPKFIKQVKYGGFHALFHLSTAKIWLDNCRKEKIFLKRKNQYYVQLWHGALPLKMVENDAVDILAYDYVARAKRDSKLADLFVSGSTFISNLYKKSFWYDGEILEKGTPKDDILFNVKQHKMIASKIKDKYNIPKNKKILLYAPTFREDYRTDCYNLDYDNLKGVLKEKFKSDYVFMVRLHPNVLNKGVDYKAPKGVIDVTKYPNLNELLIASDILITDYSSIMFSYSEMQKKVFLYCTDIDEYNKKDRKFYFDIESLPFLLIKNNDELKNKILSFNTDKYYKELNNLFLELGMHETGKSSYEIAKLINDKMFKKKEINKDA